MPESSLDGRMTGAELLVIRETLGLTGPWIARVVGTATRNERRWEADDYRVPDHASQKVYELANFAEQAVDDLVARCRLVNVPRGTPGVILYRNDDTYARNAPPGEPYPARWHRAIAGRALDRVPGLRIAFFTDDVLREPDSDVCWFKFAASTRQVDLTEYVQPTRLEAPR